MSLTVYGLAPEAPPGGLLHTGNQIIDHALANAILGSESSEQK